MPIKITKYTTHPSYSDIVSIGKYMEISDVTIVNECCYDPPRCHEELYILYKNKKYFIENYSVVGDQLAWKGEYDNIVGFTDKDIKTGRDYQRVNYGTLIESSIHKAYITEQ